MSEWSMRSSKKDQDWREYVFAVRLQGAELFVICIYFSPSSAKFPCVWSVNPTCFVSRVPNPHLAINFIKRVYLNLEYEGKEKKIHCIILFSRTNYNFINTNLNDKPEHRLKYDSLRYKQWKLFNN